MTPAPYILKASGLVFDLADLPLKGDALAPKSWATWGGPGKPVPIADCPDCRRRSAVYLPPSEWRSSQLGFGILVCCRLVVVLGGLKEGSR